MHRVLASNTDITYDVADMSAGPVQNNKDVVLRHISGTYFASHKSADVCIRHAEGIHYSNL